MDHPIPPSRVLCDARDDIAGYALSRTLKDPTDAAEYYLERTDRPHVNEFLGQLFGMLEDLHERGVTMHQLLAEIDAELPALAETAERTAMATDTTKYNGQLCTAVWQALLQERLARDISDLL